MDLPSMAQNNVTSERGFIDHHETALAFIAIDRAD
jgi:hypothetical protein